MMGLLRGCLDKGCVIKSSARVESLLTDTNGRISGVRYVHNGDIRQVHVSRGVILATGGFEWDSELRESHFPGPFDRCASPPTNEGDGQRMAAAVGACLDRMDQANIFPTVPVRYEGQTIGLPSPFHVHPNAIIVNANGNRFCSEYDYNLGVALDQRNENGLPINQPAWVVADKRLMQGVWSWLLRRYARQEKGWLKRAGSIERLAETLGVSGAGLTETVSRFNKFSINGKDEDFGRGDTPWERFASGRATSAANPSMGGISQPPYFAFPINRSIVGTKGGPRTNEFGQVVRHDGSVIHGLHCAGNAMANPIGTRAIGAGSTIGPCMTWGYICGKKLAEAE